MDILVALLLNWLSEHSTYDTTGIPLPTIIELSPEELTREYYSDQSSSVPSGGVDERIVALYSWSDGPNGTIYILHRDHTELSLSQERGLENPLFQERLLHELVHHFQYQLGKHKTYLCKNQGELEAYMYGGKFLQLQNVRDPLPNRRVLAHLYSRC